MTATRFTVEKVMLHTGSKLRVVSSESRSELKVQKYLDNTGRCNRTKSSGTENDRCSTG